MSLDQSCQLRTAEMLIVNPPVNVVSDVVRICQNIESRGGSEAISYTVVGSGSNEDL